MRGVRGAASVAEEQHFMTFTKGSDDQLGHFHDPVGMLSDKLLLDRRAVVEGLEDEFTHRWQF